MCLLSATMAALGQSSQSGSSSAASRDSFSNVAGRNDIANPPDSPARQETKNHVVTLPPALFRDQIGLWTSPARARFVDATWLVPL